MTPADSTRPARQLFASGPRHLMVSLLLRPRSVFVTSVAVSPGRPPQLLAAGHPWLAAVTRGDEVVHLSRARPARFEVYQDRAGQWRWRLRRAGGEVVAASSDSFVTRAEAEAEVTWIRRHAGGSPTTALD